jgi:hypothetical protein
MKVFQRSLHAASAFSQFRDQGAAHGWQGNFPPENNERQ